MCELPVELWQHILQYIIRIADLKNLSRVSSQFYGLVHNRLWQSLKLKIDVQPNKISGLIHLPIRKLHICLYKITDLWMTAISKFTKLTHLEMIVTAQQVIKSQVLRHLCQLKHLTTLHITPYSSAITITADAIMHISALNLTELHLPRCRIDDDVIKGIGGMKQLRNLNISYKKLIKNLDKRSHISDRGLTYLSGLTQLKCLNLAWNTHITADGLNSLIHLPLVELNVAACELDDSSLEVIAEMDRLHSLDIRKNTRITDCTLLSPLCHLTSLKLSGLNLSDDAVQSLRMFRQLKFLCLTSMTKLSVAGLESISLINLQGLDLSDAGLDDTSLSVLSKVKNLRYLNISNNPKITHSGLSNLIILQLEELNLSHCDICDESLKVIGNMSQLKCINLEWNNLITSRGLSFISQLQLDQCRMNGEIRLLF